MDQKSVQMNNRPRGFDNLDPFSVCAQVESSVRITGNVLWIFLPRSPFLLLKCRHAATAFIAPYFHMTGHFRGHIRLLLPPNFVTEFLKPSIGAAVHGDANSDYCMIMWSLGRSMHQNYTQKRRVCLYDKCINTTLQWCSDVLTPGLALSWGA